jgi:hypothetical protein
MSDWIWTAEVVAELARLRGQRLSFAQIAQALNERFRLSLTRNAVCGKINRMNRAAADRAKPKPEPARKPYERRNQGSPRPWTEDDIATLHRLRGEGRTYPQIAAVLKRTEMAVRNKAAVEELQKPASRIEGLEHWPAPIRPPEPEPEAEAPPAGTAPLRLPECVAPEGLGLVRDPFGGLEPMTCEEVIEGVVCGRPVRRGRVWCAECNARFRISGSARVGRTPSEARVMRAAPKAIRRGDGWERFA